MTALWILFGIFLFLLLMLLLPITVFFSYKKEVEWKVCFAGIKIISSDKKQTDKSSEKKSEESKPKEKKDKFLTEYFSKLKAEHGFEGAVKYCASLAGIIIRKLVLFIKRLKFRKFILLMSIASDDAAKTAVTYGGICSAVYPVLSFLTANADFKSKQIDIFADFNSEESAAELSIIVRTMLFTALITAVLAFKEYRKLTKESELK